MSKFKVGDYVVRNNVIKDMGDYSYTTKDAGKMEVTDESFDGEHIEVKILNHKQYVDENGKKYVVYKEHFDLYNPVQITENSTELERWLNLLNN